jgi:8-oxo-dGTP diphosphatase
MTKSKKYRSIRQIDWTKWKPAERATLLFVRQRGHLLLIHKKCGLGAGKVNGPGGRIDPGETPRQCAIREVREELCVTPTGIGKAGELMFQFVDGYSLHGFVFTATGIKGEPKETREAKPLWASEDDIPYGKMWADDRVWFPHLLAGRQFIGRFLFDGDTMLGCEIDLG